MTISLWPEGTASLFPWAKSDMNAFYPDIRRCSNYFSGFGASGLGRLFCSDTEQTAWRRPIRSLGQLFDYAVASMCPNCRPHIRIMYLDNYDQLIGVEVAKKVYEYSVVLSMSDVAGRCHAYDASKIVVFHFSPNDDHAKHWDYEKILHVESIFSKANYELLDWINVTQDYCLSLRTLRIIGRKKKR